MQSSIQKIKEIKPHPNADKLELIYMEDLAWQVVAQKGLHSVGDKIIYVEIDSVVPESEVFEFLRNKHFRVRQIRLRQENSAGLILPLEDFGIEQDTEVGTNVDEITGIIHYEKPVPAQLSGQVKGNFPIHIIPKTDERNLLSVPRLFEELKEVPCYITQKADGSSASFINRDEMMVCSRNLILKEDENNAFWRMHKKYNLSRIPLGNAVNAEIIGEGVNGNKMRLKGHEIKVFNVYDVSGYDYRLFSFDEIKEFCKLLDIPMVDVIFEGNLRDKYPTIQSLVDLAQKQKYESGAKAEGIVIRPQVPIFNAKLNRPLSVKVINPDYKET